jgi:uncharacterized membrane-anchored protein YjiN (DUF445 family)
MAGLCALVDAAFASDVAFSCEMIKDKKIRAACAESEKKKQADPTMRARKDFVRTAKKLVADKMLDPNDVAMEVDNNPRTEAERDKNREKRFCIADCGRR